MRAQHQKKKEEEKGFDLLAAIYAEKGLISGDSSHIISAKAVGETHAHSEKHHQEKEKRHRAAFVENVNVRVQPERAKFMETRHEKPEQKPSKLPPQMKKPDVEDPKKGKKR